MPKQITNSVLTGKILHNWKIEEFEKFNRSRRWYIFMIILGLALVLYGVFSGNFLFSLIIILFSIIIFLQSHQEPTEVPFGISELGIMIGNRFYEYNELEKFYIIYDPPETKSLFIDTKSTTRPLLRIPLKDNDPLKVRSTLKQYLEEDIEKEEEPYSDKFARVWKLH
ncbi:MAG: hypothetical protein GF349_04015 [Candidatus Magasanikbacteria bacterium]|nr:hypothetical protein [Candidatus Magasanikbacteria bacterium]